VPAGPASVTVNGVPRSLEDTDPATSTLDLVRGLGLTGAKEGCAEGECGACAVLVLREDEDGSRWVAVASCLVPAASLDGQEVVTVEGLGTPDHLHPVQRSLAERGGSQCGYCTPGIVCSMAAEYYRPDRRARTGPLADRAEQNGHPQRPAAGGLATTTSEADGFADNGFELEAVAGNLCRCTGYRPIRDAARALGAPAPGDALAARTTLSGPPASRTRVSAAGHSFVRPGDLAEALHLLAEHPDAAVVAGATDWGVEVNLRGRRDPVVVAIDRLPELREVVDGPDVLEVGAALTLSEVERRLAGRVPLLDRLLPQFASRLVRNAATIGGNLATASPIGDLAPGLIALDARLVLASAEGEREVPVDGFFTGYRRTLLRPGELIRSVRVPLPTSPLAAFHKVAKRRLDDISGVAVAVALVVVDGTVTRARIGLGGVAATPLRAGDTEAALEGRPWDEETVAAAAEVLRGEGTPLDDLRASADYRRAVLGTALGAVRARLAEEVAG
jgi:xanthine dehydrogenase small subunit